MLSVPQLLQTAQHYGVHQLMLTDINNTSGVLDFVRLSAKYGVQPAVGIDFRNGAQQQFIGCAINNEGFRELNEFLSACSASGEIKIPQQAPMFQNVFVIYSFAAAPQRLRENEFVGVRHTELNKLLFSSLNKTPHKLLALLPVTVSGKTGFNVHRLLRAIDTNALLSKVPPSEFAQPDEVMCTEADAEKLFASHPQLIINTKNILKQCHIAFDFHENKNKKTFSGSRTVDRDLLFKETMKGMAYRYGAANTVVQERVAKELKMIDELGFASYFLINWDIIRYARRKNYFYVGRGSGANSMVAYCLRITDVDPVDLDLYFERFINPFRTSPPDFDLDFSWKDRDELTDYIFRRHGKDHVALLATYSTFQSNAVIRELGKVFGLPKAEIDALQDNKRNPDKPDHITQLIHTYSKHLHDMPNHLSIHAGGVLISEKPISWYTAVNMPPKGFPTTQFSMLEAEDIGLYKFDILSQRGLGHIKDTVEIVKQNRGEDIDVHDVKRFKQDEKIKALIRNGKCMGCFYVESPAMRMLLRKLRVETYLALVAASSIIRPGVARSGMMREYILRTHDAKRRTYIHPVMKELMEETFGIMVYQEDVIKVAHHFAGLSLSESDVLRRGMSGKFRSRDEFDKIKDQFFGNCKQRGYDEKITAEVWRQIESFAGYSFSKGHSASYAVESYQSLFLKAYYPLEFMVGVINNFGGFYRTEYYVHEARMSGAHIHAPCVNRSEYLTCINGADIFLGLIHIDSLEKEVGVAVMKERLANGEFTSLENFLQRVSISLEQIRLLIRVGAFRFTGHTKKELLWMVVALFGNEKKTHPAAQLFETQSQKFQLPDLSSHVLDDALDEMELLGFPLCNPFLLLKERPTGITAREFEKNIGRTITITGYYVTMKYTSTIRKETMYFGTFTDSEGKFFDTTHFPKIAAQFPFRGKGCYRIKGKVASEFGFCSIDVLSMEKLDYQSREETTATLQITKTR